MSFKKNANETKIYQKIRINLFVISMDVLSKILDKAAWAREFGYQPWCKTLGLTHLCFADDLMILTGGKIRSVDGIVKVMNFFAKKIRVEN